MTDLEIQINATLTYNLNKIAAEIDACSPELRNLIRMACAGANGEAPIVDDRTKKMAAMRLNEAATTRTAAARAARKAATLLAFERGV